jgi:hypothetical protein
VRKTDYGGKQISIEPTVSTDHSHFKKEQESVGVMLALNAWTQKKQGMQYTDNVTVRPVCATAVAMENQ